MKNSVKKSATEPNRQKAEELLKNKQFKMNSQLSEADTLKLMHELQVHQIELELQNEELMLAKEKAETASEKYTELYNFAPIGYFTLSKNAIIVELNLLGAKMLGKERSQLQNKHFSLFVSDGSRSIFNFFIENIFKSNNTESCEVALSVNYAFPIYVYLTGIYKENEKYCFVTAVDITQRKQMETELIREKKHAEESNELKTAFLQNMSHEIRTPINAIKGFSSLLIKNYNNEAKLQQFTKIIDQRSNDLLDIINDILDIAKIESGQLPVYKEECNLTILFEELTTQCIEYQQRLGKQHINFNLQVHCDSSDTVIVTDKGKLKQIFINLLTNALKFTDNGKIEGGCKFDNNNLLFYVTDTGIGIPADKQKNVFERFVQLNQDTNQVIGGTGLGLSIIKGLVSLLGGEIFLESEPGKGSTFSFTFPYEIADHLLYEPLATKKDEKYHFFNRTILIVEDDTYSAEYLKEILLETGINILFAKTGSEAIQKAENQLPDLVLMDIRLPDMDGYEATRQIRQHNPMLKIIAQTAFVSQNDKQNALNSGFNDYICKPIDEDELLTIISKHL